MAASRVIGIVRVSRTKGVDIVSPGEQRARLTQWAKDNRHDLVEVMEELDVSGGTPLARRKGLLHAVETVERGGADVIVASYFDRVFRSLAVQAEVIGRVEAAGGKVFALDIGQVSNATATQWMSNTFIGTMAEYMRRTTAERTHESKVAAVMRGVAPYPRLPLGVRKNETTGRVEPDPATRALVLEAFRMRANGSTRAAIRDYLIANGHTLLLRTITVMLANRLYLGELAFGDTVNPDACEPIVPAALFRKVQTMSVLAGRKAKSDRLLARLGILRCAGCDGRMVVFTSKQRNGTLSIGYRCGNKETCTERAGINAEWIEEVALTATQEALRKFQGRGSNAVKIEAARARRDGAVAALEAAVEAFDGLGVAAAKSKLGRLQVEADAAAAAYEELLGSTDSILRASVDDFDRATADEQRRFVRYALDRIKVRKHGVGGDRVEVTLANAVL